MSTFSTNSVTMRPVHIDGNPAIEVALPNMPAFLIGLREMLTFCLLGSTLARTLYGSSEAFEEAAADVYREVEGSQAQ